MSFTAPEHVQVTATRRRPGRIVSMVCGLILAVFALAACASRPSADELTDSVLRAGTAEGIELSNDEASCIADQLLNAGLADATLAGLAEDFNNPEVSAADVDRVEAAVADAAVECAGG
jgi:hypothetical protein